MNKINTLYPNVMQAFMGERQKLCLHYDVNVHALPWNDFVRLGNCAAQIASDFNKNIYGNEVELHLFVFAPEEGGLLQILAWVGGGILGVAQLCDTGMVKEFTKGLSGKTPQEYAYEAGQSIESLFGNSEKTSREGEIIGNIVQRTKEFISYDCDQDLFDNYPVDKFSNAFRARNDFYETCLKNKNIRGIGFKKEHDFPIKREDFSKKISTLRELENNKPDKNLKWKVEQCSVEVKSPNWGRFGRRWVCVLKEKEYYLRIEDDSFWNYVASKSLSTQIMDKMTVQWARPIHAGRQNPIVLKVLTFNGEHLAQPLSKEELRNWSDDMLDSMLFAEQESAQPDLFG